MEPKTRKERKPISLHLPYRDNFEEWYNYYSPVLYNYYLDFITLFDNKSPPDFLQFMEYCYINTKGHYNRYRNIYQCKILLPS